MRVAIPPLAIRQAIAALASTIRSDLTVDTAWRAIAEYGSTPPAALVTPRALTRKQAAAALSISPRCLTNWLRDGKVRAVHLSSRAVRIPESEVARLLTLLPEPPPTRNNTTSRL